MKPDIIEPFEGCDECKETGGFLFGRDDHGEPYTKKCSCLISYQIRQKVRHGLYKANLPIDKVMGYDISSYKGKDSALNIPKIKKFVYEFNNKYSSISLYLYGPNGTQKTTVSWWMGREIISSQGRDVYYILMDELIKSLTKEDFDPSVKDVILQCERKDLLIIDESFDTNKVNLYKSGYQISFLDRFLRKRMEQDQKSIVFISNNPVSSIRTSFGDSIYHMVNRNTIKGQFHFQDVYDDFDTEDIWKD